MQNLKNSFRNNRNSILLEVLYLASLIMGLLYFNKYFLTLVFVLLVFITPKILIIYFRLKDVWLKQSKLKKIILVITYCILQFNIFIFLSILALSLVEYWFNLLYLVPCLFLIAIWLSLNYLDNFLRSEFAMNNLRAGIILLTISIIGIFFGINLDVKNSAIIASLISFVVFLFNKDDFEVLLKKDVSNKVFFSVSKAIILLFIPVAYLSSLFFSVPKMYDVNCIKLYRVINIPQYYEDREHSKLYLRNNNNGIKIIDSENKKHSLSIENYNKKVNQIKLYNGFESLKVNNIYLPLNNLVFVEKVNNSKYKYYIYDKTINEHIRLKSVKRLNYLNLILLIFIERISFDLLLFVIIFYIYNKLILDNNFRDKMKLLTNIFMK